MTVVNPTDDNTTLWAGMLNAFANAHGAGGIVSGCSISKGTGDWDIDVTSGTIIESNTEAAISSGTVTITDASALSAGESRVTLIHADTGDTIASTDGSAAANPATPDIPAGEVLLGFVVVSEGDTTVADSDIFDIPSLLQNVNALYKDGGSHELDAADLSGGAGTNLQFLQSDGSAASWSYLGWETLTISGSSASNGQVASLSPSGNLRVISGVVGAKTSDSGDPTNAFGTINYNSGASIDTVTVDTGNTTAWVYDYIGAPWPQVTDVNDYISSITVDVGGISTATAAARFGLLVAPEEYTEANQ